MLLTPLCQKDLKIFENFILSKDKRGGYSKRILTFEDFYDSRNNFFYRINLSMLRLLLGKANLWLNFFHLKIKFHFSGFLILKIINLDPFLTKVILLEVMVPIAVSNVNLAALFDNKPEEVAWLVILTSVLFIPYFYFLF